MTLEQYAYLAEMLGSAAVVISLIFVGIQLARANRETRTATMQAAMFREMENSFRFAEHASTWDKVITGAPLSEGEEIRRALGLYNAFMTDCEYRYRQFKGGYLDAQTWDARNATLPLIVRLPIFEIWRSAPSGKNHAADFLKMLDDLILTGTGGR
ncbi:MAG: hypothetical protein PVH89_11625 [Gammaproteobacteria bacterium]|jgi:hypothetical protein